MPDRLEAVVGSDPARADTDGDGLTDAEELAVTTDPTRADTDGNGIGDADADGLNNRQELIRGTQTFNPDTDYDGLGDGDEVRIGSNPSVADADQVCELTMAADAGTATAVVRGTAAALVGVALRDVGAAFDGVAGVVSTPVNLTAPPGVSSAVVTLAFDPAAAPADARLAVSHLNEETGRWERPAEQSVDTSSGVATVVATAFSPFVVVDLNQFEDIWRDEIVVPRPPGTGGEAQSVDVVLSVDGSGSMLWFDQSNLRFDAADGLLDSLLPDDRAAVVGFDTGDTVWQGLTADAAAAKAAVRRTFTGGGTSISAAVEGAIDVLDTGGAAD
ncbi:MAG: VWA domain-containing protein, partial [Propionibacteriaceae bacterium]|nr:VWA domain-containing protein [Propionibacteriaceae bacterium]